MNDSEYRITTSASDGNSEIVCSDTALSEPAWHQSVLSWIELSAGKGDNTMHAMMNANLDSETKTNGLEKRN